MLQRLQAAYDQIVESYNVTSPVSVTFSYEKMDIEYNLSTGIGALYYMTRSD